MQTARALSAILLTLVVVLAGGQAQDGARTTQLISAADGGEVKAPSGKAVLTIPPGALPADTQLTIAQATGGEGPVIGPAYDIGPDELKLQKPATLTVHFSRGDVPEDFEPEDVAITSVKPVAAGAPAPTAQPGQPSPVPAGWDYLDTEVDAERGTATTQLTHFSRYVARAYASHRLGDREHRHVRGLFDYGLKHAQSDGAGSASANYGLAGEIFVKAAVPVGQKGTGFAHAELGKFFRVKPGADGQRSTDKAAISIVIEHNALLGAGTNQYHIALSAQSLDGTPQGIGTPALIEPKLGGQGQFRATGLLNQAFFTDPVFGNMTKFPLGPRYQAGELWMMFEQCKLEAGKFYSVHLGLNLTVNGEEPDPEAGIPAKGGSVEFQGVLGPNVFFIKSIAVLS